MMPDTPHSSVPDAGTASPPRDTDFRPAAALDDLDTSFTPDDRAGDDGKLAGAKQTILENGEKLRAQAEEKARDYVVQGKAKATDTLGELSRLLTDAAQQVDDRLGAQYGQYARSAADRVQGFAEQIDAKSADDLIADARELVRKSPALALGIAATVGFAVARLLGAGLDQRDA